MTPLDGRPNTALLVIDVQNDILALSGLALLPGAGRGDRRDRAVRVVQDGVDNPAGPLPRMMPAEDDQAGAGGQAG